MSTYQYFYEEILFKTPFGVNITLNQRGIDPKAFLLGMARKAGFEAFAQRSHSELQRTKPVG